MKYWRTNLKDFSAMSDHQLKTPTGRLRNTTSTHHWHYTLSVPHSQSHTLSPTLCRYYFHSSPLWQLRSKDLHAHFLLSLSPNFYVHSMSNMPLRTKVRHGRLHHLVYTLVIKNLQLNSFKHLQLIVRMLYVNYWPQSQWLPWWRRGKEATHCCWWCVSWGMGCGGKGCQGWPAAWAVRRRGRRERARNTGRGSWRPSAEREREREGQSKQRKRGWLALGNTRACDYHVTITDA